ncbi:MAG TPA: diguanylate cyclase, partial [Escherichia coli]|nr:diguanylate cyclase [Escherichia coli]
GLSYTILLMFIGGTPGSTAGGIKTTTIGLLTLQAIATLRGHRDPTLAHRRFLPTIFKREIAHANRTGTPLSVLIIDVDKFKEINDTWGHNTGDEILRKVSQAFYDNVRSSDYVFRYGGDEFIIVLTEASENETLRTAERIRSRVEKTKLKAANGEDIALSLSIGAAMFNGHPDYERLIQIADEALYIAKRRGRNRVELWKASL